jgi:NAD(P)H-flavin reductase
VARGDGAALGHSLFDGRCKPGDRINVRGPSGDFVLSPDQGSRALVFAACDTGFAPVKSLIEHAIATDQAESIQLYWLATRADGHYLANQCRAWAASLEQFRFACATASDPGSGARDLAGRIVTERRDLAHCCVYAAGTSDFVDTLMQLLPAAGLKPDQGFGLAL